MVSTLARFYFILCYRKTFFNFTFFIMQGHQEQNVWKENLLSSFDSLFQTFSEKLRPLKISNKYHDFPDGPCDSSKTILAATVIT